MTTLFKCSLCSSSFASFASVRSHVGSEHKVDVEEAICAVITLPKVLVAVECKLCALDNIGSSEESFGEHLRTHHNVKKFKPSLMKQVCRLCGFVASKNNDINQHLKLQHPLDDFAEDDDDDDDDDHHHNYKQETNDNHKTPINTVTSVSNASTRNPTLLEETNMTMTTKASATTVASSSGKSALMTDSIAVGDLSHSSGPLSSTSQWTHLHHPPGPDASRTSMVEAHVEAILDQHQMELGQKKKKSVSSPSEKSSSTSDSSDSDLSSSSSSSVSIKKTKKRSKRQKMARKMAKLQEKKKAKRKLKKAKAKAKRQLAKKHAISGSSNDDEDDEGEGPQKKRRKPSEKKIEETVTNKDSSENVVVIDSIDNVDDVVLEESKELIRFTLTPQKPVTKGFIPIGSNNQEISLDKDETMDKARDLLSNEDRDDHQKVEENRGSKNDFNENRSSFVPHLKTPNVPSISEALRGRSRSRDEDVDRRRRRTASNTDKSSERSHEIISHDGVGFNDKRRDHDRRNIDGGSYSGSVNPYDRPFDFEKVNEGGPACELCNVRMDNAESAFNHFSGRRHQERIRNKIRCYLCAKYVDNAKAHLEQYHYNDVFQCNMRGSRCARPKFLDLAKVINHMTAYHNREIRNLSNEELIARRMVVCAENLHSYRCRICSTQFVGQPLGRVFQHQRWEDGVQRPLTRDLEYHCRICGNARFFEDDEALKEHIDRHRVNIREIRDNLDSQDDEEDNGRKSRSLTPVKPIGRAADSDNRSRSNSRDLRKYGSSIPPASPMHRSRSPRPRSPRSRSPRSRSPRRSRSISLPLSSGLLFCPYCLEALDREATSLRSHIQSYHMEEAFQCLLCDESEKWPFFDYKQVSHHIRNVHKDRSRDMDEREIKDHCVWPRQLMAFKCMQCLDSFYATPDMVERHFEVAHSGNIKHPLDHVHFFCRICCEDLPMEDKEELEEHLAKEHKPSSE